MAVNETYRLRLIWRHDAALPAAVNDFYFKQLDPLVFDTAGEDLWEAFNTVVMPSLPSLITNQLALFTVQVAKAPLFLTEYQVDSPGITGTASGDALPPTTCTLITRKSDLLTKRGRGRIYLPAGSETFNGNGKPSTAFLGAVQTVIALFQPIIDNGLLSSVWRHMVWSPADQIAREVTSSSVRDYWALQRDRRGIF